MLMPRPPRPVAPRRAVPEVTVRYRQPTPISIGHVLPAATRPDAITGSVPGGAAAIRFTVVYQLREYLDVLREHLPAGMLEWERSRAKAPTGRLSWSARIAVRVLVPLLGTPIFLLKKRRMPVCRFAIDAQGIERRTRDGTLRVAWADVVAVHRYRQAWLVDKGNGGMPIPHRCLDPRQRSAFERLLVSRFGDDTLV